MQEHLRYRERFNHESVRFIVWFLLVSGVALFMTRLLEAFNANDPVLIAPISIVVTFTLGAFVLFNRGHLQAAMIVLLLGSSFTMLAASYVFSFTASMAFWLVQAALLVTAGGVFNLSRLMWAVAGTLLLVVLSFALQKTGFNLGKSYGPRTSDWLALIAVCMLLGLSGAQSMRFARLFEQTIRDLSRSSERLAGLLKVQEDTNRQFAESEARYRLLIEHTPAAIVRYDTRLIMGFHNPALLQLFGLGRDLTPELSFERIAHPAMLRVMRAALEGQAGQYEGAHVNLADGRPWWIEMNCTPLRSESGEVVGAVATIRDESSRRARELELSRTRDIADQASQARNRFLSLMSHEIRTPMNEVYGYAQLLLDARLPEARQSQLKRNILKSSQTLVELVDEIVDASKMEAGLLRLEEKRFEPVVLLRAVADQHSAEAADKGLQLEYAWQGDDPGYLLGDANRIRQMLGNLLHNAVRYTPSGFIQAVGEVLSQDGSRCALKFSVTDSGLGIAPERQSLLFAAPGTVDASDSAVDPGGPGLGLAIVKRLALLMEGDVGVVSEPGNGSTFWFIVNLRIDTRDPWDDGSDDDDDSGEVGNAASTPRDPVGFFGTVVEAGTTQGNTSAPARGEFRMPSKTARISQTSGKQDMNILLVEDNPTNAQLVQDMLELEGFTVHHAANGQEALDMLYERSLPVDVVLMDCRMPVMDGYECTQRIRQRETESADGTHLPIIALTANVFEDDRNRCMQVGMDDFLRKPVDLTELVKTLHKHAG